MLLVSPEDSRHWDSSVTEDVNHCLRDFIGLDARLDAVDVHEGEQPMCRDRTCIMNDAEKLWDSNEQTGGAGCWAKHNTEDRRPPSSLLASQSRLM